MKARASYDFDHTMTTVAATDGLINREMSGERGGGEDTIKNKDKPPEAPWLALSRLFWLGRTPTLEWAIIGNK